MVIPPDLNVGVPDSMDPFQTMNPFNAMTPPAQAQKSERFDDSALTLIADFYSGVCGTPGFDHYDETVLYRNGEGGYEIHTYSGGAQGFSEVHHGYRTSPAAFDAVTDVIRKNRLAKYEGKRGVPICGGMVVVRFRKDDRIVRISTDNLPPDKTNVLYAVGNAIRKYLDPQREIRYGETQEASE